MCTCVCMCTSACLWSCMLLRDKKQCVWVSACIEMCDLQCMCACFAPLPVCVSVSALQGYFFLLNQRKRNPQEITASLQKQQLLLSCWTPSQINKATVNYNSKGQTKLFLSSSMTHLFSCYSSVRAILF